MVQIKTEEEMEIMRQGGKILAEIMQELAEAVRPEIKTEDLDGLAKSLVLKYKGKCSFLGYSGQSDKPYPNCLCTSINEEIVHAVPSNRILKQGDIISLDLGFFYKGFHTDMATTLPVGKISPEAEKLILVTKKSLEIGIENAKLGNKIGDISRAIQKYVEGQGFNVVRELCGHGIGKDLHEEPEIVNFVCSDENQNIGLKQGMVLCLEPMVTVGDWHIKKSKDGFGYQTKDGSLSCHFEHTIAVTKEGYKILTKIN